MTWKRAHDGKQPIHVYPLHDLREHDADGKPCWCRPRVEDDGGIVIHNSADQREKFETGERKRS